MWRGPDRGGMAKGGKLNSDWSHKGTNEPIAVPAVLSPTLANVLYGILELAPATRLPCARAGTRVIAARNERSASVWRPSVPTMTRPCTGSTSAVLVGLDLRGPINR